MNTFGFSFSEMEMIVVATGLDLFSDGSFGAIRSGTVTANKDVDEVGGPLGLICGEKSSSSCLFGD